MGKTIGLLTAYPHRIDGGPDRRFKVYQRDRVVGAPRTGGTMGPLALMAASVALPYAIAAVEKGGPPAVRWARLHGPEYGRRVGDGARRLLRHVPEYRLRAGDGARRLLLRGPEYGRRAGDGARRLLLRGPEYGRRAGDGARRLLLRGPDAGAGEWMPDGGREALEVLRAGEAWTQADARAQGGQEGLR